MHRNAPLTPEGRRRLCELVEDGWTVASAAESMRISRQTAHKWWRRYREAGVAGLEDRSSRPRRCPTKTPAKVERRVVALRRRHQVSAARLCEQAGIPASTLHRIWARNGVSRLSDLERRSGRVVRRIETSRPGELVHVDVKKQAKIPKGGGWRVNGVAAVYFALRAPVAWPAVAALALGSVAGGQIGGVLGRRLPAPVLRAVVVLVGVTVAAVLFV